MFRLYTTNCIRCIECQDSEVTFQARVLHEPYQFQEKFTCYGSVFVCLLNAFLFDFLLSSESITDVALINHEVLLTILRLDEQPAMEDLFFSLILVLVKSGTLNKKHFFIECFHELHIAYKANMCL